MSSVAVCEGTLRYFIMLNKVEMYEVYLNIIMYFHINYTILYAYMFEKPPNRYIKAKKLFLVFNKKVNSQYIRFVRIIKQNQ